MTIQENINLASYTTFKIGGKARFFCIVKSIDDLKQAIIFAKNKKVSFFVLGGGSNILVSDEGFGGLVIKMEIEGKKNQDSRFKIQEESQVISVGAGENWDLFVEWTVKQGFNGLENLSSIPGTVGAAPVQNIGAYGVEVGQFISSVNAFDTKEMKEVEISGRDCHFGYRNSLFKKEKGRRIITHVNFALNKNGRVNVEYKDIQQYFDNQGLIIDKKITPVMVREAVVAIRKNKLPDWTVWGTAGSFFKNPVVSKDKFDQLKFEYPGLPGFPEVSEDGEPNGQIKIPLGWVLDNICRAKGMMSGSVGTYEKQALVIVTKSGATAKEVVDFTKDLMKQVKDKTGITVEAEVEWVN